MTADPLPGASSKPGLISRLTARLATTESELEDIELKEDTWRLGATPIDALTDRADATVCGAVRSVTLRPRVNVPALVVELYDGSKTLNLVWLGRRHIAGILGGWILWRTGLHTGTVVATSPAARERRSRR